MADRLPPEQRAVLERLARGELDVDEAERLLAGGADAPAPGPSGARAEADTPPEPSLETEEEARARELVERIARDIYGDEETAP